MRHRLKILLTVVYTTVFAVLALSGALQAQAAGMTAEYYFGEAGTPTAIAGRIYQ